MGARCPKKQPRRDLGPRQVVRAGMEGRLRLMDGQKGPGYEYGRIEIFLRGFWSTICDDPFTSRTTLSIFPADGSSFTPDAAQVACSILGYSGGASLEFREAYNIERSPSRTNKVTLQMWSRSQQTYRTAHAGTSTYMQVTA